MRTTTNVNNPRSNVSASRLTVYEEVLSEARELVSSQMLSPADEFAALDFAGLTSAVTHADMLGAPSPDERFGLLWPVFVFAQRLCATPGVLVTPEPTLWQFKNRARIRAATAQLGLLSSAVQAAEGTVAKRRTRTRPLAQ